MLKDNKLKNSEKRRKKENKQAKIKINWINERKVMLSKCFLRGILVIVLRNEVQKNRLTD